MSTYLQVTRGVDLNAKLPLNRHVESRIGRDSDCQVQISDKLCSRVHAKITFTDGNWTLFDAGSRNGTTVNGSKTDQAVLNHGDKIQLGGTEFLFVDDSGTDAVTVEFLNHSQDLMPDSDSDEVPNGSDIGMAAFRVLKNSGRNEEVADLHQLSMTCLSLSNQEEVAKIAGELLRVKTQASC